MFIIIIIIICFTEPKKTAIILSGIMNFLHFRKQRMDIILEQETRFVCLS